MRQILPRAQINTIFATGTDYWVIGGAANQLSSTFGPGIALAPVPWACTFRNIAIYCNDTSRTTPLTLTLRVNAIATALSVTLPVGETYATNSLADVSCDALDYVDYQLSGAAAAFPGYTVSFSIEHDGPGNYFALASTPGAFSPGDGIQGGCLGCGVPGAYTAGVYSGSGSICSVPGTITKIALRETQTESGGSWTAYIRKNNVLQDGSGGTVDTAVTLLDTEATRKTVGTISLPVVPGDICEVVVIRNGTAAPSNPHHVSVGIGFTPTDDGWFMLTGGFGVDLPGAGATSYAWVGWDGNPSEATATAPVGPVGIVARGLYVARGALPGTVSPGSGETFSHTLLKGTASPYVAGTPTAVAVTIADTDVSGSINGLTVSYPSGSSIVIRHIPSASAPSTAIHWGLALTFADVEGEAAPGVIGPHQWIVFPRTQPEIAT